MIDGVGQGYNATESTQFSLQTYNGGAAANNQGYVIIKARLANTVYPINSGRLKITNQEGLEILDLVATVQYALGNSTLTDQQISNGDMNNDGGINILDIVMLTQYILDN